MTATAGAMRKTVFESDALPTNLDDRARFRLYRDMHTALYGSVDLEPLEARRFHARLEFAPFGCVALGRFEGTIGRITRTRRDAAADGSDNFCIGFNCGLAPIGITQVAQEPVLANGSAVLLTNSEAGEVRSMSESSWYAINVSRKQLLDLIGHAEDLIGAPLDPESESTRHLRRYIGILLGPEAIGEDPALIEHIGRTLLDLMVLSLGAERELAQLARMRGLRAARAQQILSVIKTDFADAAFTPNRLALKVGLSPRYIQELLQETGESFTERVLELRLLKARTMLTTRHNDRLRISEIAEACGFNEISYFNQAFRRRFGASPTHFRDPNRLSL